MREKSSRLAHSQMICARYHCYKQRHKLTNIDADGHIYATHGISSISHKQKRIYDSCVSRPTHYCSCLKMKRENVADRLALDQALGTKRPIAPLHPRGWVGVFVCSLLVHAKGKCLRSVWMLNCLDGEFASVL